MLVANDRYEWEGSASYRTRRVVQAGWKHVPYIKGVSGPTNFSKLVANYGHRKVVAVPNPPKYAPPPIPAEYNFGGLELVRTNYVDSWGPQGEFAKLAYNRAYAKFKTEVEGGIGNQASLGVSVAEGREAIAGIIDRATRLRKSYAALRRGRFKEFLRQIGGRPRERHKKTMFTRPKDASALWLEYWLAWAPLVGDINASVAVLTDPHLHPPIRVKKGARVFLPGTFYRDGGNQKFYSDVKGYVRVSIEADVKVVNLNTHLASRMGLNNWAGIAWAVVPFSFIVDWFANIGDILDSYTDFAGLEMSNQQITCLVRAFDETRIDQYTWGYLTGQIYTGPNSAAQFRRVLTTSLPRPSFRVQCDWDVFSPTRAATAISLLLSIFTKG